MFVRIYNDYTVHQYGGSCVYWRITQGTTSHIYIEFNTIDALETFNSIVNNCNRCGHGCNLILGTEHQVFSVMAIDTRINTSGIANNGRYCVYLSYSRYVTISDSMPSNDIFELMRECVRLNSHNNDVYALCHQASESFKTMLNDIVGEL